MSPYARRVSVRKIFAIVIALSVLFAPGVAAAAMASPHHDMQMMEAGHCRAPTSSSGDHQKMAGKSCCIALCMAVAVAAPGPPSEVHLPPQRLTQFPTPIVCTGSPQEIATPPPRHS